MKTFINKYNPKIIASQDLLSNKDIIVDKVSQLTRSRYRIFTYIYRYLCRYNKVDISQGRIARHMGYSRQTINEALVELSDLGLIIKIQRGPVKWNAWQTCLYILNDAFKDWDFRKSLAPYFKILTLMVYLLLPFYAPSIELEKNPTLMNRDNIYNYKNNCSGYKFTHQNKLKELQDEKDKQMAHARHVSLIKNAQEAIEKVDDAQEKLKSESLEVQLRSINQLDDMSNTKGLNFSIFAQYAKQAINQKISNNDNTSFF